MKELLVLPLLMPLGLALVVGLLNLTTPSRLKFLLWSSPPLSLGSWVMLGAGGGAALSAALSATAADAMLRPDDHLAYLSTQLRPANCGPVPKLLVGATTV